MLRRAYPNATVDKAMEIIDNSEAENLAMKVAGS